MKRFWIVLLAAALAVALALPASAQKTTVSVSGSYYAQGFYIDNFGLDKRADGSGQPSVSFTAQRFRIMPVFTVAPGLTATLRMDLMERIWGADRLGFPGAGTVRGNGIAFAAEDENIGVDFAFVTFVTKPGTFMVGYQPAGTWGLVFGDDATSQPRISFSRTMGPWTVGAIYEKVREQVMPTVAASGGIAGMTSPDVTGRENNWYYLNATYRQKNWTAGVLFARQHATVAAPHRSELASLSPFFTGRFGALTVQAEMGIGFGKARTSNVVGVADIDDRGLRYILDVRYTRGPLTIGALYAFAQGDDPASPDKNEGTLTGGPTFNPMMMLWHDEVGARWAGGAMHSAGLTTGNAMTNASLWQVNLAYRVTKDLGLDVRFSSARMDEKSVGMAAGQTRVSADIGREFSIQATYNIFANLNYQVGFAHFWTGDAFKGGNPAAQLDNNFLVQHRLNLTF